MTPESKNKMRNLLIHDEDIKLFPYTDITGHLTIGCGRNLAKRGISQDEALYMLNNDIFYFTSKLSALLLFFNKLSETRQIVLICMAFNLGIQGLLEFSNLLEALKNENFDLAADQILSSEAARQLPDRYHRFAYIMRTNTL